MAHELAKNLAREYSIRLAWLYDTADIAGVPSPQDIGPIRLEQIYVPLRFRWSSDRDAEQFFLPQVLEKHRHVVVLGDPGSGKSTLVKVIVDMFGRSGSTPLKRQFGELLPIPIVLRDYNVRAWQNYEQMLTAYLEKLRASITDLDEAITPNWLYEQLQQGNAILLLDGLDEVGSRDDRRHLRDKVVRPLLKKIPDSYVLLTSRVVGYDEAPFEGYVDLKKYAPDDPDQWTSLPIGRCYAAPFNDEDIEQFVVRWYSARESDPALRRDSIASLQSAIKQNDRVHSLATNPQLLTLMAIVHRAFAELPSGRVELYDKVAEAYLLRIDRAKKLASYPASLDEMKRWLARVGWEMQARRDERDDKKDLLATKEDVENWLQQAIAEERGEAGSHEEAKRFLDHIARRSGLLIPRGPEEFAFAHLTFQEYFAACHLGELAFDLDTLAKDCAPLIERRYWHETLCVLFEILAKKFRGAADRLFEKLYETVPQPKTKEPEKAQAKRQSAAELFSELLLDEQNGLTPGKRKIAADFTLAETCRKYNYEVIDNLKLLPSYRCDELLVAWFAQHLQHTSPDKLGRHFFVVGSELRTDWPQRLAQWVAAKPNRKLDDLQVAQVALFAAGNAEAYRQISRWAVERMSLLRWLAPINYSYGYGFLSLADVYRKGIDALPSNFAQRQLLLESHTLSAIRQGQMLRLTTVLFACALARAADFDFDLARTLAGALDRALAGALDCALAGELALASDLIQGRSFAGAGALALAFDLAGSLGLVFDFGLDLDLVRALTRALAEAMNSPQPALQNSPSTAAVEWLFFAPDAPAKEYDAITSGLYQLTSAQDDWRRLQGLTSLLALGAGSPKLFAEQNALIEKGIKHSQQFTFPAALHAETETPEFRAQLPDLFKLIFLHDPDDPETHWLQPEFFDPSRPESKYFLSKPREFFILAADALDPNGETELGQWRRNLKG